MAVSSVELIINAAKAVTALKQVDKEGKKVQQVMGRAQGALYNLGEVGARATKRLSGGLRGAARNAKDLNSSLSGLRGGFARIGGAIAAKEIIQTGISAIESERRIKLLTSTTGDTAEALGIAERAAKKFGLSQTEANTGVARLLARLKPMGMSLETIEATYNGFNTASRLAGATASESAGAFLQLTQALGSGVLRGQELNSILEQAPLVAQAIAQEMNVTVGALKKLGEEGKILAPVVIAALTRVNQEGAGKLAEALKGPGQQFRNLSNAAVDFSETATNKLLPAILPVVNAATELLKGFVALPEPVKAIIVGTAALALAFAALPPAILLVKGALIGLKIAFLAFPFVAAAAGLVAIGVAAAQAAERISEFNKLTTVNSHSVDELAEQAKKVKTEMEKLEPKVARNGRAARVAAKKYKELADALEKIEQRSKVLSQEFVIGGIKYDANMVPINPPETVSDRRERLAPKPETEAERKARLRRQKSGQETADSMFQKSSRDIQLLGEQTELGRELLKSDFARADALERINKLEGVSAEKRQQVVDITNQAFDAQKGSIMGQAISQDVIKAQQLAEAQRQAVLPLERQKELLEAKLIGNEKEIALQHQIEDIMNNVNILNKEDAINKVKAVAALENQVTVADRLQRIYDNIGQTISSGIVDSLMQATSVSEALGGVLNNIARQMMQLGINTLLRSTGLGIFANLSGFANGGRPPVGRPSIVGERGPELFVPGSAGTIVPNHELGGGGGTSVVVNVDASGTNVEGDEGSSRQLGALVGAAVQNELIKQQRPGGLLSR